MEHSPEQLNFPRVEDACAHEGELSRVAAWLLDCLDRHPPPPGGLLTFYLCYSERDRSIFFAGTRDQELVSALLDVYRAEVLLDGQGFGDLRFDLSPAPPPAHFALRLRAAELAGGGAQPEGESEGLAPQTLVEIHWQEADGQVAPGTLRLVRRWLMPLAPDADLTAKLAVVSGAKLARHVARGQREAARELPIVYMTEGRTTLLAGPHPGFDLYASSLSTPLVITYDSRADEWSWSAVGAPTLATRVRGSFELACEKTGDGQAVSLRGERLAGRPTLAEVRSLNRRPAVALDMLGCLLPCAPPKGYGLVPYDLPPALASRVQTGIRLPGGGLLYFDEVASVTRLLRQRERPPGVVLMDGERVPLWRDSDSEWSGLWSEAGSSPPPGFHGEILFDPPLTAQLVSGTLCEDLPGIVFADHCDVSFGRSPLRLESDDGLSYALVFNPTAQYPIFVSTGGSYGPPQGPAPGARVEIKPGAEFLVGGTHYRLRRVAEAKPRTNNVTSTPQTCVGH